MQSFTETQQNPYRWYLVAFTAILPVFFFRKLESQNGPHELWIYFRILVVYSLVAGFVFITLFKKISYDFDQHTIRYRIKPFGQWQIISWSDVERAYVREFALYGEYPKGLGGIRQGPNGWAYVMDGTYGLQINRKSGGKILLGTQRPAELQAFLNVRASLTTT